MSNDLLMIFHTVLTFLLMWVRNERVWQMSYAAVLTIGFATSAITYMAVAPMVALVFLLVQYRKGQKYSLLAGMLALALGLALGLHVLPGFNNYEYLSDITLSVKAASFNIWFNWDKSMFGLFVLGIVLHRRLIRSRRDALTAAKSFFPIAFGGTLAIYAIGMALGYSSLDLTPNVVFLPWAIKNIVFTVLAEEVFFRGLIQNQLARRLNGHLAVVVAGVLFGAVHFGGGVYYVFLSSMAGILYGYTYKVTGRIEAPIITHFLLNAGHFLFFTYPYSAI